MSERPRALLMIGSQKAESTSLSLGGYLMRRLSDRGWQTDTLHIRPLQAADKGREELLAAARAADLVVLAFPVYVDSLPAAAFRALEWIAADRRASPPEKPQRFVAITNCGYPESVHTILPLTVCRRFAKETGFAWAGGLGLGGGGAISGKPLEQTGGMGNNPRKALDLAAEALAAGQPVPERAEAMMAKAMLPAFLYRFFGNFGWNRQARQIGGKAKPSARPYDPDIERR